MRIGKKDKPKKTPEQKELERRVDAMMNPGLPDYSDGTDAPPAAEPEKPAIERLSIKPSKAAKTAPELPTAAKKITVSDANADAENTAAKPLSIDKLDQLTKEIVGNDKQNDDKTAAKTDEGEEEPGPSMDLDDVRTDEAVDDIVAHEGDIMLAVADATAAKRSRKAGESAGKSHGLSNFIWFLVALAAVLAIAISVLMATGGNLPKL